MVTTPSQWDLDSDVVNSIRVTILETMTRSYFIVGHGHGAGSENQLGGLKFSSSFTVSDSIRFRVSGNFPSRQSIILGNLYSSGQPEYCGHGNGHRD